VSLKRTENRGNKAAKVVPDYEDLVREARKTLGIEKGFGKPLISRYVTERLVLKEIGEGDPGKYIPSFIRDILQRVRDRTWKGSILQR